MIPGLVTEYEAYNYFICASQTCKHMGKTGPCVPLDRHIISSLRVIMTWWMEGSHNVIIAFHFSFQ